MVNNNAVRTADLMKLALIELQKMGGQARFGDLAQQIESHYQFTPYEQELLAKTGYVRWKSHVLFTSVDFVKAGFLQKQSGKWILTEDGAKALSRPANELLRSAQEAYRMWRQGKPKEVEQTEVEVDEEAEVVIRQTVYETAIDDARSAIESHIREKLGAYEFQNLVAELLTAMGYYISTIAPPGRDGGVDIVAYRDAFGVTTPRIKIQVKHQQNPTGVSEIRELHGLLKENDEIGLFVSSGGFTSNVTREARSLPKHLELIDLSRLIDLWQTNYEKVSEKGKALLPLRAIYFLAPIQE